MKTIRLMDNNIESTSRAEVDTKYESFKLTLTPREKQILNLVAKEYLDKQIVEYKSFKLDLTPREQEVLDLISEGYLNKQIAKCLRVAESTVKNHVCHIFEKLGVSNRTAAAVKAIEFRSHH